MGTVNREVKLRSAAQGLRRSGIYILILLALGSLAIGISVSHRQTCTSAVIGGYSVPDCRTETDELEAALVAASVFIGGLVLYYPLYFHLSVLSEAVADLLAEVDSDEYPSA